MAHSTKKTWTKPAIRQFETPEEILEHYREHLPHAELEALVKRAQQLQQSARRSAENSQPRRSKK